MCQESDRQSTQLKWGFEGNNFRSDYLAYVWPNIFLLEFQNLAGWCLTPTLLRPFARHLGSGKWSSRTLMNARHDTHIPAFWVGFPYFSTTIEGDQNTAWLLHKLPRYLAPVKHTTRNGPRQLTMAATVEQKEKSPCFFG